MTPRTSCRWNYLVFAFCNWLISCNFNVFKFHPCCRTCPPFFLRLSIPYCAYTTFCLSVHPPTDMQAASTFWLLWTKLLWTCMCKHSFVTWFSIPLGTYPELGYTFLILTQTSSYRTLISTKLAPSLSVTLDFKVWEGGAKLDSCWQHREGESHSKQQLPAQWFPCTYPPQPDGSGVDIVSF